MDHLTDEDAITDQRPRRMANRLLLTVVLVIVGVTSVIIMVSSYSVNGKRISTRGGPDYTEDDLPDPDGCLDVAIIGGGIGGAYTAWRLKDRGLSVSVFEYSDRVGGRLFTTDFPAAPGTYLDFGGMRFKSAAHPLLTKTITDLGLNIIPFALGFGNPDETIWYTRAKQLRAADHGTKEIPYNLEDSELKDLSTLIWQIVSENVNLSSDSYPSLNEMYTLETKDGTRLYEITVDNFYGQYASREAANYILETSNWEFSMGPLSAINVLKHFTAFPGDSGPSEGYKTVDGGMGLVPVTLMEKFLEASDSHKLYLNHQLLRILRREEGGYDLLFRKTTTTDGITTSLHSGTTMCAKKVVLAVQKDCIQAMNIPEFRKDSEIQEILDSVVDYPAGRIFLAYNTQWWKVNNPGMTHSKSDLPNKQTYDWSTGTNNVSIIMASYHDGAMASRYWRELQQFGTPIPGSLPGLNAVTDVVKDRMEKYLSLIYGVPQENIPEAVGGGMMLWDSYPFSAAWSYFKPGVDERFVRERICKPSASDDIYIVSNSWAADDKQGWSEGTLDAVEKVLGYYFP